jgi:hypothetical protein
MEPLFSLHGQDKCGLAWYIDGYQRRGGAFYALVQVGSTKKLSEDFDSPGAAKEAGVQLVADTLAELVEDMA